IGPQIRQLFAVTAPKCHTLRPLVGKLPWSCRWRRAWSCCRIERPHIEFIFSGLVRYISNKPIIGGKPWARDLEFAAENLDRFPFSRARKRQRKYRSPAEVRRKISQVLSVLRPVGDSGRRVGLVK